MGLFFYCGVIGIESGLQVIPFSEVVRLYIVTLFHFQYYSDFYYGTHVHKPLFVFQNDKR